MLYSQAGIFFSKFLLDRFSLVILEDVRIIVEEGGGSCLDNSRFNTDLSARLAISITSYIVTEKFKIISYVWFRRVADDM